MTFWKKHAALIVLFAIVGAGFYNLGFKKGEEQVSAVVPNIANQSEGKPEDVDFTPFWKAWNIINDKYVPASTTAEKVDDQEKVWGAIKGLAGSLKDPYTVFFPPVESKLFESDIRGNFEGVGMEVLAQDGAITVISPLKNSPAMRAGIAAGDRIIRINGTDTAGLSTEDAVQRIRGPRGTAVSLTLVRQGVKEPFTLEVTREVIDIPTISTRSLPNGIFVIELYSFSAQSPNLFRRALREFVQSNNDKIIVDLRGNPGGYLEASIDIASWFLPASAIIVKEDFSGTKEPKVYRSKGYDIFNENLKMVILVDKGSASASEILAGALSEHDKAVIVGEKTFGKGSVQELVPITGDTSLKLTVARWLTPNGVSISEKGIEPDVPVEKTATDTAFGEDPQMTAAIRVLVPTSQQE